MTTPSPMSEPDNTRLFEALARHSNDPSHTKVLEPTEQLVLFRLAGQRFALKGRHVSEILSGDQSVYFVPGVDKSVEGVIHLRGKIESVITLHPLLGLEPTGQAGMLLLVNAASIRTGVRIDQLDDVCEVEVSALKPPPETQAEALKPFVSALIHPNAFEAIAVLDADALLTAFQSGRG